MPAFMFPGKIPGAYLSLPSPSLRYDTVIPRGPKGDCLTRAIRNGKIDFSFKSDETELKFPEFNAQDEELLRMAGQTDFSPLLRSFVGIRILYEDGLDSFGSGFILKSQYVVTCAHIFEEKPITEIQLFGVDSFLGVGKRLEPNTHCFDEIISMQSCFRGVEMMKIQKGIDIAFISMDQPAELARELQFYIPEGRSVYQSLPIATAGFPGLAPSDVRYTKMFPFGFVKNNEDLSNEDLESRLKSIYEKVWHNFEGPVASFGRIRAAEDVEVVRTYYQEAVFSTSFGLSGSPVVPLNYPGQLLGMVVGGFEGENVNIFLSFQSDEIRNLINSVNTY